MLQQSAKHVRVFQEIGLIAGQDRGYSNACLEKPGEQFPFAKCADSRKFEQSATDDYQLHVWASIVSVAVIASWSSDSLSGSENENREPHPTSLSHQMSP
jgi:hypothetical protein